MSLRNLLITINEVFLGKILRVLLLSKSSKFRSMIYDALRANKDTFYCVNTDSLKFLINLKDNVIGRSVFCTGEFDLKKIIKVKSILAEENINKNEITTLIDVGANIGTICIPVVASKIFNNAVAIEPHPVNFQLLNANSHINDLQDKILTINKALGDLENEELILEESPDNLGDNRVVRENDMYCDKNRYIVESTTLDNILQSINLDITSSLLWIDTQGYEGWVLKGACAALSRKPALVLEFWPYGLSNAESYEHLKLAISHYDGFYDLSEKEPIFRDIDYLDHLYNQIGFDEDLFTDILVISHE